MESGGEFPYGGQAGGNQKQRVQKAEALRASLREQLPQLPHGLRFNGTGFLPDEEGTQVSPSRRVSHIDQSPHPLLSHGKEGVGGFGFRAGKQRHGRNPGELADHALHDGRLVWWTLLHAGNREQNGSCRPAPQVSQHLIQRVPVDGGEAASGGYIDTFLLSRSEQGVHVVGDGSRRGGLL
jgi:hypothetical protein